MTVADLLERLRELDIRLQVSDGKLLVDAPQDVMSETVRAGIRKHRDELVQLLGDQQQKLPPLIRQPREQTATAFPLSISQHAFFMLDRLSPRSRAFNIFSVRELTGRLDVDRLAQAWNVVVNKHDALRTAIQWHNGNARQMVYGQVPVEIELIDLSGLAAEQLSGLSTRLSGRQAAPHFELEQGRLFKLRLIREQANRHVLVMSVHHIVADDRSVELLYRDLVQAYAGPIGVIDQSALPQYPDYAAWERNLLDSGGLDQSIDYWRSQLADMPALLPQRVSSQILSEAVSATIHLELDDQLAQQLWQLAAATETSRFAVVLSAFQLLWALRTGQPDVPVIVPATSRDMPETNNMVGLFVNAVVMRARLDEQGGIAGVIKANAEMINASLTHRIISLEALEGILRLRGEVDLNLDGLSRIGFNYLVADADQQALTLGDLTINARPVDRIESVFAILLVVQEYGARLRIKLEYREDIWSAAVAQQFADQFVHVLSAFCDPRNEQLKQITAVPEQYLQQVTGSLAIQAQTIRPLPPHWRRYFGLQQQLDIPCFCIMLPFAETTDRQAVLAQLKPAIVALNQQLPGYFSTGIDGADDLYMYTRSAADKAVAVSCCQLDQDQSIAAAVAQAKRSIDVSNDQLGSLLVADDCCVLVATALPGKTIWQHWLAGLLSACPAITTPALDIHRQTAQQLAPQLHYSRLSVTGQQLLDIEDYCRQHQLEPVRLVVAVTALLMNRFADAGHGIISWPIATDDTIAKLIGGPQYYRPAQDQQGLADWLRQTEPLAFNGFDKTHRQPQDFTWLLISGLTDEVEDSLLQTQHGHWLAAERQVHLGLMHSADSLELECSLPVAWHDHCFVLERICAAMAQIVAGELNANELDYFSAQDAALLAGLNANVNQTVNTDLTVVELFANQLQDRHQHPALLFADQAINYAELDTISNSYAQWLQQQTSNQPQVVGVCLQRTPAMVAILLGIWRAGCAWVPVDATLPAARMDYMLAAAGATGLVVSAELQSAIPELSIPLLAVPEPAQLLPAVELPSPDADSLAYIMFTSGSTGQPKGVRITHAMLSNLLQSMLEAPGIQQHQCMLAITSLSFDIALLELFMPLVAGATVCLSDSSPATNPGQIIELLNSGVVDLCQATPSSWRLLLKCGWQGNPELRVICGGEPLDHSLAENLLASTAELWNAYGPTETTIWSTLNRVNTAACASHIGQPIANTWIRVMDESGQLAAVGEVGELVIGGTGVTLGYCGNADDLQAVFFSDEQAGEMQRFYRTGDRVKVNRDGRLVFIGRTDRQIKLRGVRIELNEIESTLNAISGVSESAVWLHTREPDSSCIAAAVAAESSLTADQVKAQLREQLPAIMLPERLVVTQQLPRLASGKLDRKKLLDTATGKQMPSVADTGQLEDQLVQIWSELLGHDNFALTDNFFDIGGHSMLLIAAHQRIVSELEVELEPVELFTHTSIAALVQFLRNTGMSDDNSNLQQLTTGQKIAVAADEPIAIIGIAGRFPQADDVSQFWQNLCAGREAIQELDEASLLEQGVPAQLLGDKSYVSKASLINGIEDFDADFFGLSAREVELIDPQQRVLLELAYQTLEEAGYDYQNMLVDVGLFAGVGISSYLIYNLWPNRNEILNSISPLELLYANDKDYAATRISYLLNLRGPSLSVGTACSTGLVAVHQACTSLRQGECEMALAGAVKIAVPQNTGYIFREGGIMSPDGHCRPFDRDAAGTVFGSGGCCVLLKPLSAAERDGDPIHALIRGSAVNNDGHDKLGFTAPSVTGQANVISAALKQAGVAPQQLSYVEAHGTGTRLGDPVEVAALQQVFAVGPEPDAVCGLGSVKSNLGHLDTAAGITGLAKVVLSLQHGQLPPTINFSGLNEQIKLDPARFRIQTGLSDWPAVPGKRFAGVSSFGIGGTNAHVVLQDYLPAAQASAVSETERSAQLVVLSGDTETALRQRQQALADHLSADPDIDFADLVYTLQSGRPAMRYRSVVVAGSVAELQQQLQLAHSQPIVPATHNSTGRVVFLFPGQGLELASHSAGLYQRWPVYRQAFDHCAELVAGQSGLDLRQLMLNESGGPGRQLRSTMVLQPALFAAQYSLTQLLMSIGIRPAALLGHSLGEITAACIAGVFSLEQAVRLVVARGELMQAAPEGAMLAVFATAQEVTAELGPEAQIAANNGTRITVISGSCEELEATRAALASQGIDSRLLPTDRAFHSSHMDQASAGIKQLLADFKLQSPMIPMLSNLDGQWADAGIADGSYWARQARQPVKFIQCLQTLELTASDVVIELDLNASLTRLVMANNPELAPVLVTASPEFKPEVAADRRLLALLGFAWQRGCVLDWNGINPQHNRKKLHLPVYAFSRQRYWIQRPQAGADRQQALTRRNAAAQWLYQPAWMQRSGLARLTEKQLLASHWVVFVSEQETAVELAAVKYLLAAACRVVIFKTSTAMDPELKPLTLVLEGADPEQLQLICAGLAEGFSGSCNILYGWAMQLQGSTESESVALALCRVARVAAAFDSSAVKLCVVTENNQPVTDPIDAAPAQAVFSGALQVLQREHTELECRLLDVDKTFLQNPQQGQQLLQECLDAGGELCMARRNDQRWARAFCRYPAPSLPEVLETGAVYVITGGLGGIGALLAEHLITNRGCKVALIGRTPLNDQTGDGLDTVVSDKQLNRYQYLNELQPGLLYHAVDVADVDAVQQSLGAIKQKLGVPQAIIHAAGSVDGQLAELHSTTTIAGVLKPKLEGSLNIMQAAASHGIGRVVLFSSISAVTGEVGQYAYAAANAFQDALAEHCNLFPGVDCFSINWDTWRDVGMAAESAVDGVAGAALAGLRERGLANLEGLELFDLLVSSATQRVLVSTVDLDARIQSDIEISKVTAPASTGASYPRPALDNVLVEPQGELETSLSLLWAQALRLQQVGVCDNYFELGGTSLQALQVVAAIESEINLRVAASALLERPTIRELAAYLEDRQSWDRQPDADQLLVALAHSETANSEPLYLMHPIGGQVYLYRELAGLLSDTVNTYAVRAAGIQTLDSTAASVESLASDYLAQIKSARGTTPKLLGGSSFGGMIAYAMAQQLAAAGKPPALLIMLDTPDAGEIAGRFSSDLQLLHYLADQMPEFSWLKMLLGQSDPSAVQAMLEMQNEAGGGATNLYAHLSVLKQHMQSMQAYTAQPYAFPVVYIKAAQRRAGIDPPSPEIAWQQRIAQFTLEQVNGDHISMHMAPHVAEVAAVIKGAISTLSPERRIRSAGS